MAFNRTRHSPGIETHEIDKSQYSTLPDYSIVNTITFAPGFASKGPDYTTIWVNSMKTFVDTYGYPTNDPEKFLYYTAKEILSKGGVMLASKLPYKNESKDAYAYVDYDVSLQGLNSDYLEDLSAVDKTILSSLDITFHDKLYSKYKIEKPKEIENGCTIADITNTIHNIVTCDHSIDVETLQQIISHITNIDELGSTVDLIIQELNNDIIPINNQNIKNLANLRDEVTNIVTQIASKLSVDLKLLKLDDLDKCIVNRKHLQPTDGNIGKIRIVDKTRRQYGKFTAQVQREIGNESSMFVDTQLECLGIMPVIVTPMNALPSQGIVTLSNAIEPGSLNNYEYTDGIERYNVIRDFRQFASIFPFELINDNLAIPFRSDNQYEYTLSQVAARNFPTIRIKQNPIDKDYSGFRTSLDREYLKFITVIVFEVYADKSNNNKLAFSPAETFTGSLDPDCKDENGSSLFIDDVVNSQSEMIYLFSNITKDALDKADIVKTSEQVATSLGFNAHQCIKHIDYKESILDSLDIIFEANKNPDVTGIDLVVDAGVTNIAANEWLRKLNNTTFDWHIDDQSTANVTRLDEAFMWRTVAQKYVDFCRYTRKDCMAIIDGIRRFCLNGDQKRVRDTLRGSTIANQINPLLKYMTAIDSSYAAGYCNWFRIIDDMSGEFLWLPPSIKAAGIYTYSDAYYSRWAAPAGLRRGPVVGAVDIAFNPVDDEAGKIYDNGWNYAVSYPLDGIILEGQKTFQVSKSAFDRVNVRRLFLYLEKQVKAAARYFVYEHNTAYQRQQFVDRLKPLFESVKKAYGIADYIIKCDESINTPEVIDNNTMRCVIGIRPIKVVEWIVCDFVCTNQSVSVAESIQGL